MPIEYYYAAGEKGDEQRGPVPIDKLVSLEIGPTTLVWREGMDQWHSADSIDDLRELWRARPAPTLESSDRGEYSLSEPDPTPQAVEPVTLAPGAQATAGPGAVLTYHGMAGRPRSTSGLAIASMVLGIISCLCVLGLTIGAIISMPCSILAMVFGFTARGQVKRGETTGGGMALAGIICGFVSIGLYAVILLGFVGLILASL